MAKYFPTTLKKYSLKWCFTLPQYYTTSYEKFISIFQKSFKQNITRLVIIQELYATKQGPNEILHKFILRF